LAPCLTADAWSSQRRAFLGITIQWLDEVSKIRHSKALAFKRFIGTILFYQFLKLQINLFKLIDIILRLSNIYARISDFISSIMQEYQLEGKVQLIVMFLRVHDPLG
jgi:hypothetical protein